MSRTATGVASIDGLLRTPSVLLTGPANPDGDSVGACLALARVLSGAGVRVQVAGRAGWRYAALPGASDMVPEPSADWHTVVVLDGDRHRLSPSASRAFDAATRRGIIDHHGSTQPEQYDWAWVEPQATSTCEMLYSALRALEHPIDLDIATLLHLGSIFDTGCFRYDNTTPRTLAMAADLIGRGVDHAGLVTRVLASRRWRGLQATARIVHDAERRLDGALITGVVSMALQQDLDLAKDDLEGIVEALADVVHAQVGALFVEQPDGSIKVSLRSRGHVDVCAVARAIEPSGGGHQKASGVRTERDLSEAQAAIEAAVARSLGG